MIAVFFASFFMIAAKAFQQLNVVQYRWLAILPTSCVLAAMEVLIVIAVVKRGFICVIPMAIGGALGCLTSMWLHQKLFRPRKENLHTEPSVK